MRYKAEIVVKWFAEHGLIAVAEYKFHEQRKWRFDFAFPKFVDDPFSEGPNHLPGVALEVQGGLFTGGRHSRGPALLKEHEKLNAAACAGWRILYTIPDKLCMPETIEIVKAALAI